VKRVLKTALLTLFVFSLILQNNGNAEAQDEQWEIRVNQLSTLEGPEAMTLKVYFTIYDDRSGTPMLNVDARSAQITLLNTNHTSNGELKSPDLPIYIVLLLDASGSMSRAAGAIRNAAKLSLNDTPNNAFFSVVQFNEDILLLQDFTQNIAAVSFAIDRYQVAQKGTCLYDAGYTAVDSLLKAPMGRRAIILFADGIDETFVPGKQCSKHTYQELLDYAHLNQVPINTIGLTAQESHINEVELRGLAVTTGGFSAIAKQDDMVQAFQNIMQTLKAQWMVEAPIYPRRGNNDAVLNLTLTNDLSLNTAFNINSNTDYPGPPSPVNVNLAGLLLSAAQQSYEVQLNMTSPELAAYVKIEIWDQDAGSKVGEYIFDDLGTSNSFFVPTESLIVGRSYELRISAVSREGNIPFEIVRDDRGNASTQLIHEFNFDPSALYPSLQIQSLVQKSGDLALTVNVTNPELIGGFDGWLVDESTNTKVLNSDFTAPAINTPTGTITIPARANRIPNGKYTVIVRVLAKNNNVYSSVAYEGVIYKAPSLFQRLGVAFIAAPIFLVGILGIIVILVGFLMFNASRQKSLSGTPVLQGRLGGKMSGGKQAGPVLPVADDEPIPSRNRSASPPPSKPMPVDSAPPPVHSFSAPPSTPAPPQPSPAVKPSTDPTMIVNNFGGPEAGGATMIASEPLMPRATLTILQAGAGAAPKGPNLVMPLPFVIGRSEGTLIIQDPNISRKHARITYDNVQGAYFITDLNSSNGTRLNAQRLAPGQPTRLVNGAVIGLGPNVTLRFDLS
jgi:VWFA-related protein